jgi:hypothetical protein
MQLDTPSTNASDDTVVERLFVLARQGETTTSEFQLLDYVVQKRLQQTYGGEFTRTAYAA